VNKVPQMSQRLKIKVTPQTPGIKTQLFEYNQYKPIFMDYNFYLKNLRNIKQNLIKIDHHIKKSFLLHFREQSTKRIENQSNATNSWYQN
jgi:chemotaxis protein CheY-P-specific phosphatase CheC